MSGDGYDDRGLGGMVPLYGGMMMPGYGQPPRVGEDRPALTAWERLVRGTRPGGSAQIAYNAADLRRQGGGGKGGGNLIRISGDDADACQITLALGPPRIVRLPFSSVVTLATSQDPSQTNVETGPSNFPGTAQPALWPPFEAVIEWGVGGRSESVAVDVVNGASLNFVASYLNVSVAVPALAGAGIVGTSALYELSAFAGPGQGRALGAQKTVWCGSVASLAESAVFPIPRFARTAYVVGCDPAAGSVAEVTVATLRFWQSASGVTGAHSVGNFIASGNVATPFDVPAGAAYASVVNFMSVASRFAVVYGLAL